MKSTSFPAPTLSKNFLYLDDDYAAYCKPHGIPTHRTDEEKLGFVELVENALNSQPAYENEKLYVVHRLDKETSGVLAFARNKEAAAKMSLAFSTHKIKKEYLFVTDRIYPDKKPAEKKNPVEKYSEANLPNTEQESFKQESFFIESHIEKKGNQFVSHSQKPNNAITQFVRLKETQTHTLWQALPQTGKPHQIRLHAQAAGIPILGDLAHGGSPFVRLCLHAKTLDWPDYRGGFPIQSPSPFWAEDLESLRESAYNQTDCRQTDCRQPGFNQPIYSQVMSAIEYRQALFDFADSPTLRLSHSESPDWTIDKLGEVGWVHWFGNELPPIQIQSQFAKAFKQIGLHQWHLRTKPKSGQSQSAHCGPENWQAKENGISFWFKTNCGQAPGLFLDQRANRAWVRQNSRSKTVLNLFAYTSGFSLAANLGGATQTTSVDSNASFIQWSKENFLLNGLDTSAHEFWVADTFLYLKGAIKREKKFDLIVCDPPSFSRGKQGVFSIEKDIENLVELMAQVLSEQGRILLATNFEGWNEQEFQNRILPVAKKFNLAIEPSPRQDLDFEPPNTETIMKSLILAHNSVNK